MNEKQFELRNLFEQSLKREDERKNVFDQKGTSLVGFLGASVGLFVGTLTPVLLNKEFLEAIASKKYAGFIWLLSISLLILGLVVFLKLIWCWKSMISPKTYMYPDPSSLKGLEENAAKSTYLKDLEACVQHNQEIINNLGTEYIEMVTLVKTITICFLISILLLVICKCYVL